MNLALKMTELQLQERGPYSLTLEVTLDLMRALEDATRSGQEHVMRKVLEILRGEMLRPSLRLEARDLATVMNALAELEHEAARLSPNTATFNRNVQIVVSALMVA